MKSSIILFLIILLSCNDDHFKSENSCEENPGHGKLLVFIGEKIAVNQLTDEKDIMDAKFLAKYKVLEKVCGDYINDTVEFIVYDHYGRPAFEDYKTVMLYLSEYEGKYYHEKYQYHDLYKTIDGRWASPFNGWDYKQTDTSASYIQPVKIDFAGEVSFNIRGLKKREVRESYPEPFYRVTDNKAIAIYGNYVQELFELKKRGVLKARGLFGIPDTTEQMPTEIEELVDYEITKIEKIALLRTWSEFVHSIDINNSRRIKELSLDSVICSVCEGFASPHFYNDIEPIDTFIITSFRNFPKTELWKNIKRGNFDIHAIKYANRRPEHFQPTNSEGLIIYELSFNMITNYGDYKDRDYHRFQFVKVREEFKFYGMESH